jgi:hypothetical protein
MCLQHLPELTVWENAVSFKPDNYMVLVEDSGILKHLKIRLGYCVTILYNNLTPLSASHIL